MKLKGLYQKTDSRIFYYQPPMSKGVRPKPISLGTKDPEEAVAIYYSVASEQEERFKRGSLRMEAARFIQENRRNGNRGKHSPATSEHYERVLEQAIEFLGNREVGRYSVEDMKRLHEHWADRGLAVTSLSSYFGAVGSFFTWAVKEKLIKTNPVDDLDIDRRVITRAERYCVREERDKLMNALPKDRLDLALCLWLGFYAGLRKKEIVEARRNWVDLGAGVLTVQETDTFLPKGKDARTISLSPKLSAFLTNYLASVEGESSGFLLRPDKKTGRKQKTRGKKAWRYRYDPRAPFAKHTEQQGLGWVGFHTMRHTWATLHALGGTPLTTIAKEMGGDSRKVFETYVGYTRANTHAAAID